MAVGSASASSLGPSRSSQVGTDKRARPSGGQATSALPRVLGTAATPRRAQASWPWPHPTKDTRATARTSECELPTCSQPNAAAVPPLPALKPWTSAGRPCRPGLAGSRFCPGISADTCTKLAVNKAPHSSHGRWPGSVLRTPGGQEPMSRPQRGDE